MECTYVCTLAAQAKVLDDVSRSSKVNSLTGIRPVLSKEICQSRPALMNVSHPGTSQLSGRS